MFARFCDPVVLTDKGEFGLGAMGWIFTFPCHRFSHFDDVAGVNFDVTRQRAGFQVTGMLVEVFTIFGANIWETQVTRRKY